MMTDPIADMLTRIRNANGAYHANVEIPASKLKLEIARILHSEGFIRGFQLTEKGKVLRLRLKYGKQRQRVITRIKRVSTPGRRTYANKHELPKVLGGLGIAILSTSRGVMTSHDAAKLGIGGEVLCYVW